MEKIISTELEEFNRIYREFDNIYHDIALHLNLSGSAFTILYNIFCLGDGCLQRDICNTSYISKQTVNSSIRKLEKDGYLYLEPGKGRDMHIHLTSVGKEFLKEKIRPVVTLENQAFAKMSPNESSRLLKLSQKYITLLHGEVQKYLDTKES